MQETQPSSIPPNPPPPCQYSDADDQQTIVQEPYMRQCTFHTHKRIVHFYLHGSHKNPTIYGALISSSSIQWDAELGRHFVSSTQEANNKMSSVCLSGGVREGAWELGAPPPSGITAGARLLSLVLNVHTYVSILNYSHDMSCQGCQQGWRRTYIVFLSNIHQASAGQVDC